MCRSIVTHQLHDFRIVGDGTEDAADAGAGQELLQSCDHDDGDGEGRQQATSRPKSVVIASPQLLDIAGQKAARIGGEDLQQPVLHDDREAEGDEQGRHDVPRWSG